MSLPSLPSQKFDGLVKLLSGHSFETHAHICTQHTILTLLYHYIVVRNGRFQHFTVTIQGYSTSWMSLWLFRHIFLPCPNSARIRWTQKRVASFSLIYCQLDYYLDFPGLCRWLKNSSEITAHFKRGLAASWEAFAKGSVRRLLSLTLILLFNIIVLTQQLLLLMNFGTVFFRLPCVVKVLFSIPTLVVLFL